MIIKHPDNCITEAQMLSRTWKAIERLWASYASLGAGFYPLYMKCINEKDRLVAKSLNGEFIGGMPAWAGTVTKRNWDGTKFIPPEELDLANEGSALSCITYLSGLLTFQDADEYMRFIQAQSEIIYQCLNSEYWISDGRSIDTNAL